VSAEAVLFTDHPGHARTLAASARDVDTVVCVGGDGTAGEVLSGLMSVGERRPRLLVVPAGTGNDIARQLGMSTPERAIAVFKEMAFRAHDVIRVECQAGEAEVRRYGFLFASAGFSTAPWMKPWMKRWLPARFAYLVATARALFASRPCLMKVVAGDRMCRGRCWIVVAGNTERAGGNSLCIAPGARTDDGLLNLSVVRAAPKVATLTKLLLKAPRGTHVKDPGVEYFPAESMRVESDLSCPVDVDGDVVGTTPATFTVCPRAVELFCKVGVVR